MTLHDDATSLDTPVLSSAQAAALDRITIRRGTPSLELMQRAGERAADVIVEEFPHEVEQGIAVYAGPGNNGGDAWVVARALAAQGLRVHVNEVEPPRTDDARAMKAAALDDRVFPPVNGTEGIVVDGVLGTGAHGPLRGSIAAAVEQIYHGSGARIVALDLPTGVDATTGDVVADVSADLTISFGSMKRGHVIAREACGEILVVDIGLVASDAVDGNVPVLFNDLDFASAVVRIPPRAHKGTRKRIAIVGGSEGMAGAVILAARAALRSGAGLVRCVVDRASMSAVQAAVPEALASAWPHDDDAIDHIIGNWADVVAIGPGLGRSPSSSALLERVLARFRGAVVLDADAITLLSQMKDHLAPLLHGRQCILTPHPAEFARLTGSTASATDRERFEVCLPLARSLGATVLLKGVPTILASADGRLRVCARGNSVLATGGSGDLLTGMVATLLAQMPDALDAACVAAWAHGRAAELAQGGGESRGVVLEDVLHALREVWSETLHAVLPPIVTRLPAVW